MNENQLYTFLLVGGFLGHFLMHRSGSIARILMGLPWTDVRIGKRPKLNQRGEANADAGAGDGDKGAAAPKFDANQQKHIDHIIDERLKRERSKFADYEDLKKFKTDAEKAAEVKSQKELEDAKKYDDAKKTYEQKIAERDALLKSKDDAIRDKDISFALTNEISKLNGYVEDVLPQLRGLVTVDAATGTMTIKGKDSNGLDAQLPLEAGVKAFLKTKPHLVRASGAPGSGTPPGGGAGGGGGNANDGAGTLADLNKQFMDAMNRGDGKETKRIRGEINKALQARGVAV